MRKYFCSSDAAPPARERLVQRFGASPLRADQPFPAGSRSWEATSARSVLEWILPTRSHAILPCHSTPKLRAKVIHSPLQNARIFLLTLLPRRSTISLALNKKSAQKQKVKRVNNGFSQAVVSYKATINSSKNRLWNNPNSAAETGCFILTVFYNYLYYAASAERVEPG
jgi:hypothetical protein